MLAAYGIPYRVVIKDFRGKERVVFGEVPVVEDEQELHSVLQSLDGVRHAPRKVSSDCKATESFLKNKEGGGGGGSGSDTYGGKNQTSPLLTSSMNVSPFSLTA